MKIVKNNEGRALSRLMLEKGRDTVEESEACLRRFKNRSLGKIRQLLTDRRSYLSNIDRTGAHHRPQVLRRAVMHIGADYLHPGPEGWCTFPLIAFSGENLDASEPRIGGKLLDHARLSTSRLAGEHDQPAILGDRMVETVAQTLGLGSTPDKPPHCQPGKRPAVRRVPVVVSVVRRLTLRTYRGERVCDVSRAFGPLLRCLREHLQNQHLQSARKLWILPGRRYRWRVDVLGDDSHQVIALKRTSPG